jgi:hypothetical protein
MKSILSRFRLSLLGGCAMTVLAACASQPANTDTGAAVYSSPEQAVDQLVEASRADDKPQLLHILGPDAGKLIYSGDAVADREHQQHFVTAYDTYHRLDGEGSDKETLVIGPEEWPVPIPLVRVSGGWSFDAAQGAQAIVDRRIGRNELNVITVCREYVAAQRDYAEMRRAETGKAEFAQHLTSNLGRHDGLYWTAQTGKPESPFGPLMAAAQAQGYGKSVGTRQPYHGYYFRILTKQGPAAAGGERNDIQHGRMTRGFALIAFPAVHGDSGIKSFIVNQNGIVYERDLGKDTATQALVIDAYNPDDDWSPVD